MKSIKYLFMLVVVLLSACSSMKTGNHTDAKKYKDNIAVSGDEYRHDLDVCDKRFRGYLEAPLVLEPKSKEEYFRDCLASLGYHEKDPNTGKKSELNLTIGDIELILIKVGK
ncbi:MAG: hypothetical protein AB7E49_02060 [Campylobacterales bacterium]